MVAPHHRAQGNDIGIYLALYIHAYKYVFVCVPRYVEVRQASRTWPRKRIMLSYIYFVKYSILLTATLRVVYKFVGKTLGVSETNQRYHGVVSRVKNPRDLTLCMYLDRVTMLQLLYALVLTLTYTTPMCC